jgi:polar amino acid transport system substrate-binding protein
VRRRPAVAALAGALALAAGVATAQGAPPATGTPGTLTVGLNLPSDGFQVGAVRGRTVVAARGFEVDLAQAIEGRLGLQALAMVQEPVFTRLLAPGPKAWDMALAQVTITDARKATVDFGTPYLTADQGVLLSLQTTARPASIADLRALRLCAQKGSTGADLVVQRIRPTAKPTLPNSVTVLTRGLRSGACQAVVFDAPTLATLRAAVPGRYGPMAGVISTGERYGVVFPKGSRLRGPVNRAIAALRKDGTLASLQTKWLAQDPAKVPILR